MSTRSKTSRIVDWLLRGLSIDLRSLAAFRIGLGGLLLVDLVLRARDLADHYTDQGVFPRTARIAMDSSDYHDGLARLHWSLHMLSGEIWGQATLFSAAALAAAWVLLGYRTRWASVASWLLLVSLEDRNPFLNDAGDTLLKCLAFWSMFLPLGATASLDARRRGGAAVAATHVLSWAGAALLLQVCIMYWSTAAEKVDPSWTKDYSAIYYALSVDLYARPLGQRLLQYPELLRWLTIVTYWMEWLGPCLAVTPLARGWWRAALVAAFWALHAGMAVTMQLGVLPWIVALGWVPFLPGVVWDFAGRLAAKIGGRGRATQAGDRRAVATQMRTSKLVDSTAALLLALVIVWNVDQTAAARGRPSGLPPGFKVLAHLTRLNQSWKMFAPRPMRDDGWFVMKGKLRDGSVVNLWEPGEPLPFKKPPLVSATYRCQRWCNYLLNIWCPVGADYRRDLSKWLQRRWDSRYAQGEPRRELESVEIIFQREETPPPGSPRPVVKTHFLWKSQYEAELNAGGGRQWILKAR